MYIKTMSTINPQYRVGDTVYYLHKKEVKLIESQIESVNIYIYGNERDQHKITYKLSIGEIQGEISKILDSFLKGEEDYWIQVEADESELFNSPDQVLKYLKRDLSNVNTEIHSGEYKGDE